MKEKELEKVIGIAFMLGLAIGIGVVVLIDACLNNYTLQYDRTMVSYEYTTKCRCGGEIEGYQSLVDGYNQEECKGCGYHAEFNK